VMMALLDSGRGYGRGSISLHWIGALAVLALMVSGYALLLLPRGPLFRDIVNVHLMIGWISVIVGFLRVGWRLMNPWPSLTSGRAWENRLARLVHVALLALLLATLLSGYLAAATSPRLASIYGIFLAPTLGLDRSWHGPSEAWHAVFSHALVAVLALHVTGALKRSLFDRDGTLRRMMRPQA